jgi:signal transduction histidine kinase
VLPLALSLLLAALQRVPPIEPWRLASPELLACSDDGRPPVRWPPTRLDYDVQCVVLEYRVELAGTLPDADELVLLLVGVHQDASVDLDGIRIRDGVPRERRTLAFTPVLIPIASGLIGPGPIRLRIEARVRGAAEAPARIRAAYLGPSDALSTWHLRYLMLQEGGARAAVLLMAAMLLFLVPIAALGPPNPSLRWYAITIVLAVLYLLMFATTWRPLPAGIWLIAMMASQCFALAAFARMSDHELGVPPRASPLILAGVAAVLLSIAPMWAGLGTRIGLDVAGRLLLLLILVDLVVRWWGSRHRAAIPDARWFVGGIALLLVLAVSDSLHLLGRGRWPAIAYLLHFGILYLVALMFVALIVRLLAALRDSARSRQTLALALAERTRELTAEFALRREAEAARMLAEERQRILRDMHDGVGGQLVALVNQIEEGSVSRDELAVEMRRTLEDLRLMVDSLDPACADLSVALGMLRRRVASTLGGSNITVRWATSHLPDLPPVPPATVLHVLRIAQEAIANALRHADARTIGIDADWADGVFALRIADDGRGGAAIGAGRGLVHMLERAQTIGATLALESDSSGTRVSLQLPLRAEPGRDGAPEPFGAAPQDDRPVARSRTRSNRSDPGRNE